MSEQTHNTFIHFEDRPSDVPVVERVWRSHSSRAGSFHSMATANWVMVVTRCQGKMFFTVRGPETRASLADCPAEGEWLGIHFRLGTYLPLLPNSVLRDRNGVTLPEASGRSFQLDGAAWEYPDFDNADTFVQRLLRRGLVRADPHAEMALRVPSQEFSLRTMQRNFLRATGMTLGTVRQIERAHHATHLLRSGVPPLQVAYDAGYFDQAHLTRSLQRFVGRTPAQVARGDAQLSFLYKP